MIMIAKLAANAGTPFRACSSSSNDLGIASTEITSMVSAKANAASTKVSRRVVCRPREIGDILLFSFSCLFAPGLVVSENRRMSPIS